MFFLDELFGNRFIKKMIYGFAAADIGIIVGLIGK
ncbi:MAG: hypothetical protein K0S39_1912 [Paenibacillus sp.]|jgi:hypothetical protein|nr:hypothetical protein [Paenibacillus sp.]